MKMVTFSKVLMSTPYNFSFFQMINCSSLKSQLPASVCLVLSGCMKQLLTVFLEAGMRLTVD